jgi:hypothetical protein
MKRALIGIATSFGLTLLLAQCGTPQAILDRGEVKNLLANAKTPKDHLKLAAHFRAKAAAFEADAKQHEELVAYYQDESWLIRGRVANAHCERLAIAARDAAGEARALAAAHEDIAKELASGKR